jgi:hypothetical protein
VVLAILLIASFSVVSAQTSPFIPAIVQFESDLASVPFADVEAGDATVTVSWYIVNVGQGQSLALDYWRQNGWISVLNEGESLPPIGEREVTLQDPLSFAEPTFRLTLLSGRTILDQQYLIIPYEEVDADTVEPTIAEFSTTSTGVAATDLTRRNARIEVTWEVENRLPDTTLIFEQVLTEDQVVNVELPRPTLYVPSEGVGAVSPVTPLTEAAVRLRLSVVSVLDGTIYASEELVVPVTGDLNLPTLAPTQVIAPTFTPGGAVAPEATDETGAEEEATAEAAGNAGTTTSVEGGPQITTFNVSPSNVAVGANVTLTWSVSEATTVQISEVLTGNQPGLTYVQLPLSGSVSVPLPEGAIDTVTYVLTARNAEGLEATSQAVVTIGGQSAG